MDDFLNTDAAEGAVCEDCGEKLSPDATFCPNCGSRRTSKPGIADTELPFQYVMPRIQNDSYTSVDSEESYSFDGGEEEYASDEYEAEEYVADLFGGEYYGDEYSDYAKAMNLPPESAERPSQTRQHANKRSLRADASEDDRLDPESKKAAICVTVAAGFIAIVLIVSFSVKYSKCRSILFSGLFAEARHQDSNRKMTVAFPTVIFGIRANL